MKFSCVKVGFVLKITTLGTSHGGAEKNRFCSSTMVQTGGAIYLIDAGAPVEALLVNREEDLSTIRGVFITHMHGDHVNGLPNLVDVSQWKSESKYTVYLPEQGGIDMLNAYNLATNHLTAFNKNRITLSHYEAGLVYEDENLKVTAVRVDHVKGMDTYGFLVEGGGKRVYITGDMSYDMHDFPELLYDIELDMIITELAHQQPADMLEHLKKCNIKTICLTHISPLEKGQQLIDMSGFLGNRMIIVEDNQILYP
jgi:ribonuclease BN (tRNA processing enzyme)